MNSQDKAKLLLEAIKKAAELDGKLKELNKSINIQCMELHTSMVEELGTGENDPSITVEGITFKPVSEQGFKLSGELSGMKWDRCDVFFNWLNEIGEDGLIRKVESVPWNTRNKFLKKWIENGHILPDFVEETFTNTVKYNKSAIKRLIT